MTNKKIENEEKVICAICGETISADEAIYIAREDTFVCSECFTENYTICEYCDEYVHNESVNEEGICYYCAANFSDKK